MTSFFALLVLRKFIIGPARRLGDGGGALTVVIPTEDPGSNDDLFDSDAKSADFEVELDKSPRT